MDISTTSSPIPLYHRIFGVLRQRVVDGVYGPGDRLAPEDELAAEFKVSRATIRQAVGELVNSGLVSRQQGRGTFVLPASSHKFGQVFRGSLADLVAETKRARIRHVRLTHDVRLPERVAESLGVEDGRGTLVQRVRTMDGRAFAYTVNHLPPAYGRLLTRKELERASLMQLLKDKGVSVASATQSIRAQLSDVEVAERLQVELGTAVLFVERLLLDASGGPVEFVQTWYRGDTYVYQVTLGPDERGNGDLHQHLA